MIFGPKRHNSDRCPLRSAISGVNPLISPVYLPLTWQRTGIDIVPTQPDFNTLGDRDLRERVHWVHENL